MKRKRKDIVGKQWKQAQDIRLSREIDEAHDRWGTLLKASAEHGLDGLQRVLGYIEAHNAHGHLLSLRLRREIIRRLEVKP